jgi:hypothetical protein
MEHNGVSHKRGRRRPVSIETSTRMLRRRPEITTTTTASAMHVSPSTTTAPYGIQKRHNERSMKPRTRPHLSSRLHGRSGDLRYVSMGPLQIRISGVPAMTYELELLQFLRDHMTLYKEFTYKNVRKRKKNEGSMYKRNAFY